MRADLPCVPCVFRRRRHDSRIAPRFQGDGMNAATADWRAQIFETLSAHDIRQVYYVPDAGHSKLIELCQTSNAMRAIVLTTEEEAMAGTLGAWLGGEKSVTLMQSSGVGNCINMLGLSKTLRYPMLMLITMRGDFGEMNP